MERSVIRVSPRTLNSPDYASLHPGYDATRDRRRVCCIGLVMTHTTPHLPTIVREIADEMAERSDRGEVASYIPELASVHNRRFGLVVIDEAGNVAAAGDSEMPFSI